jgi:hypothetical protein
MAKLHDRDFFFKYAPADTAISILSNASLRWSSSVLFNDPFDCHFGINYGFDFNQLSDAMFKECKEFIFSDHEPRGDTSNVIFNNLTIMRRARKKLRDRDLIHICNSLNDIDKFKHQLKLFNNSLLKSRTQHRILCLSEEHDNLLMWSHYAKNHSGCVIKLEYKEHLDNPIGAALQIKYSDKFPSIYNNVGEYVKVLTGQIQRNDNNILTEILTTKSTHWAYEKEWRCILPFYSTSKELFDDYPIDKEEIGSVYFGCNILPEKKETIKGIIEDKYPHAQIYEASIDSSRFSLNFQPIKR